MHTGQQGQCDIRQRFSRNSHQISRPRAVRGRFEEIWRFFGKSWAKDAFIVVQLVGPFWDALLFAHVP